MKASKRPALLLVLLISVCTVKCYRVLLQQETEPEWPPEWDLPVTLVSRGDLLARGGAMRSLGRDKLTRIKQRTSVGIAEEELAIRLDTDDDLMVDVAGDRLLHRCTGLAVGVPEMPASAPRAALVGVAAASLTLAEVFSLSSRPRAGKKILLDFDGHTTAGTDWNDASRPSIVAPAWDTDGNPDAFSAAELAEIKDVWRSVAEDFAPFDVDVTTKDPGDAALLGTGVRVVIGGNSTTLLGGQMGGIAWVGSFGSGNPAFVFPAQLYSNTKAVAEAAAHEAGHTLGLLHDGTATSPYYTGQGDWAPIMGASYSKRVTQWSKGEYSNANNQQDDLGVMSGFLSVLNQTYGSNMSTASLLASSSTVAGIISRTGQTDYFSFNAKAGPVTISAAGPGALKTAFGSLYNIGNLDMEVRVYNSSGAVVEAANPPGATAEAMGASLAFALPSQDTYYVSINGAAAGDPRRSGYSNYGSLGQYTLTVNYPRGAGTAVPPNPNPSDGTSGTSNPQ